MRESKFLCALLCSLFLALPATSFAVDPSAEIVADGTYQSHHAGTPTPYGDPQLPSQELLDGNDPDGAVYVPAVDPKLGDPGVTSKTLRGPDNATCWIDISDGCGAESDASRIPGLVPDRRGVLFTHDEIIKKIDQTSAALQALESGQVFTNWDQFAATYLHWGRSFTEVDSDLGDKLATLTLLAIKADEADQFAAECLTACEEGQARAASAHTATP